MFMSIPPDIFVIGTSNFFTYNFSVFFFHGHLSSWLESVLINIIIIFSLNILNPLYAGPQVLWIDCVVYVYIRLS